MNKFEYLCHWHGMRIRFKWYAFKFRRYADTYKLIRRTFEKFPTLRYYMECLDEPITIRTLIEYEIDALQSVIDCERCLMIMLMAR